MRFGCMRFIAALILSAHGALAEANNLMHSATLVGTWNCATARDHKQILVTFKADGTVFGRSEEKVLSGRYTQDGGSLSIVAPDQVIAASSLQVASRAASANLLNGDQISCRRIR